MQFLVPDPYVPGTVGLEQQNFLCNDQSQLQSPSSQGIVSQDRRTLSTSSDGSENANYHTGTTNIGYYPDRDVKLESHLLPKRSPFVSEKVPDGNSPPHQYSSAPVGTSAFSSLYVHDDGPPPAAPGPQPHQYTVLSSRTAPGGFFPDSRNEVPRQDPQSNFDILQPNQRGGKRGPFKDPSLREQTAQTRRIGSCIRCRMQRIRVGSISLISVTEFPGSNPGV